MKRLYLVSFLITPVVLSSLLLGAHFLRHGQYLLMLIGFIPLVALLIRHPFAVRVVQAVMVFGIIVWARTAYLLIRVRIANGFPYTILALIMGGVILLAILSLFVFRAKTLREFYKL